MNMDRLCSPLESHCDAAHQLEASSRVWPTLPGSSVCPLLEAVNTGVCTAEDATLLPVLMNDKEHVARAQSSAPANGRAAKLGTRAGGDRLSSPAS